MPEPRGKVHVPHLQAIFWALCAYALWVFYDTCNKLAGQAGIPAGEVLGFTGASGLLTLIALAVKTGNLRKLRPQKTQLVFVSGLLASASTFCNVIAVKHLPLSLFYVCVFSTPLITALLAASFLNERLGRKKTAAIALGFAGVVIAIDPSFDSANGSIAGYAAMFISVTSAALSWIVLRWVTQTESLWSIIGVFHLMIIAASLCSLLLFERAAAVVPGSSMVALMVGAGLLNLAARLLVTYAIRHTAAANVTQCNYTQILWAGAVAHLIWGDVPRVSLLLGATLIIVSGIALAYEARRADKHSTG